MTKFVSLDALGQPEAYLAQKPGPSNRIQIDQASKAVSGIIQSELTPRQKQVIELYYYHRLNTVQIARQLGLNKSTISRTLGSAHNKIYRFIRYYSFRKPQ